MKQHSYTVHEVAKPIRLSLADSSEVSQLTHAVDVRIRHGSHTANVLCYITHIGKYDVILGINWLEDHNPAIHFNPRAMHFHTAPCKLNCLHKGIQETVYSDRPPDSMTRQTTASGVVNMISARVACLMAARDPTQVTWLEPHHWEKLDRDPTHDGTPDANNVARVAAITQADFDKYIDKMEKPPMTEEEIRALVPNFICRDKALLDLFNPKFADRLPPRRPGVDHAITQEPGTGAPKPVMYGLTRTETGAVKAYIDDMMNKGFIRPSTSPYASPVLVVKKPGGGLRICVDYRQLNSVTRKNRNAPPAIKETLARMAKVQMMSLVDVIAAFNTVRVADGDEEKTAFLTRYGLYEYLVMPFGLCNAPGTFQTFINETLRDDLDRICTAYLDDVLIYSDCAEDHETHVLQVLRKLKAAGLYLDATKCKFKVTRVKYLGLILTTDGIEMDPEKVSTVLAWQLPRSVKDVQSFLGFANFYRRFIKGFSYIAKPLTALTGDGGTKAFPLTRDGPEARSFQTLKDAFKVAGVLTHFDPDRETWLETDASDFVTAAILSQMVDGILRPVAFLSHKMSPAECNYEIYDKELLAIVKAFEEWRFELSGTDDPIQVLSDHQALQTFMTTKRLNRRQARWAEFLSEFNFRIKYRPGKQGTKPDALTRRPGDLPEGEHDVRHQMQVLIKPDQVDTQARVATLRCHQDGGARHAIQIARAAQGHMAGSPIVVTHAMYHDAETEDFDEPTLFGMNLTGDASATDNTPQAADDTILQDIKDGYASDPVATMIINSKAAGHRRIPHELMHGPQRLRLELGDCKLDDGLLFVRNKVYVPEGPLRTRVLETSHRSLCGGHSGQHGSYDNVSRWYYWPKMIDDVSRYVRACLLCRRSKPYRDGKHGLLHPLPIPEKYWSSISMDYITHLPPCTDNGRTYTDILVMVDRLSKKKKFIPVTDLRVDTLVHAFVEYVWREEGYPDKIISDRGAQFVSHFWTRLCQRLGTKPKLSTAFHPETDGQTENANAYLKQYLRAYVNYEQDNWALFLPMAEFEANNAVSASTGTTAFRLTKGYDPRSGLEPPLPLSPSLSTPAKRDRQHADNFAEKLDKLRVQLQSELRWAQAKQAEYANDNRLPAPEFRVGDLVMINAKHIRTTRPSPSLDFKNRGPFRIIRAIDNMAYEVELPPGLGRLHNVFHPWLLHLYEGQPLPQQTRDDSDDAQLADPDIDDDNEYYVEEVLKSRIDRHEPDPGNRDRKGLLQYYVKWSNYPVGPDNPSWEPYMNLVGSADLVATFHRLHPKSPGPHKNFATLTEKQNLVMMTLAQLSQ